MKRAVVVACALLVVACGTPVENHPSDAGTIDGGTDVVDDGGSNFDDGGTDVIDDGGTNLDDGGTTTSPPSLFTDPPFIDHDLQRGDEGLDVDTLQFELKLVTGANLDEDGDFGGMTLSLLHAFEAQAGLVTTDVADEPTRTALHELADVAAAVRVRPDDDSFDCAQDERCVPDAETIAANLASVQVVAGEGDRTGTYMGQVGFNWGDGAESTSIRQGSPAHIDWVASNDTSASERRVIGVISRNEGPFDAVNSYDAGDYTWGAYQLIGAYRADAYQPGDDELSQGLAAIKHLDPAAFYAAFERYGIDVDATWNGDALVKSSVAISLTLPDGNLLTGKAVWERVGTDAKYNQIFINAGSDPRIQRGEVLAAKQVHFDALDVALASGRPPVRDYLTSERVVCAFLDQELNRGRGGTLGVYASAIDSVAAQRGIDPSAPDTWPDADRSAIEHDIVEAVLAADGPTTRYGQRLSRVLSSVFLSDDARSFVPLE